MKLYLIPALVIICSAFCSRDEAQEKMIRKAGWLAGTWEQQTNRGSLYETWKTDNDHTLSGKSYFLEQGDTFILETILLIEEEGRLWYKAKARGQNNDQPVSFAASLVTDSQMVFENPQHDFPQVISYTRTSGDALTATISGMKNGQERKQTFRMKRLK